MMNKVVILLLLISVSGCQMSSTKIDDEKLIKKNLNTDVKQRFSYALQLMGAGEADSAFSMLNEVSNLNDSLSGPYVNRGLIYLQKNNPEKAELQFVEALKRNAKNVTALNQLAIINRKKKDFISARKNYEAALDINPQHANAHLNLGVLCDIYLQDKPCAMKHFKMYVVINGEDKEVTNWIIDLREQL